MLTPLAMSPTQTEKAPRQEAFVFLSLGPVLEYELLLQVAYRDPKEKRKLKNFLKLLKPPSLGSYGPMKIIGVKATTCKSALWRLGVEMGKAGVSVGIGQVMPGKRSSPQYL